MNESAPTPATGPKDSPYDVNFRELMEYYHKSGRTGALSLKWRLARSWVLQQLAYSSPTSDWSVRFQRARGVRIGHHVFIGPHVEVDLLYPHLVRIEDNVSMGSCKIFAHSNPTNSVLLKTRFYPREVKPVLLKRGAWIAPGSTILCGVTVGENSVIGAGSVVVRDVDPWTVVAGVPAKLVKSLEH